MNEIWIENSQNVLANSPITAGGNVHVGDQITNFYNSAQYQDLKSQLDELEANFATTRQRIDKYPDDKGFQTELLAIDQKRNEVQKKLDELKSEVIRLAETFTKIPINTERLKLAQQHFEAGNYTKARAILDAEKMGDEQSSLLQKKEQQQQQLAETDRLLINNANEFLILARLTAVDFDLPDRFEKTVEYFEQSLKAAHTFDNTFAYAYFLQQHNQFNDATPFYQEALTLCQSLTKTDPQTYLPYVATTLNNLALLQKAKNEFPAAEAAYQEALKIYRHLAEANPQTYLPYVAMSLNNLALLQKAKNEFPAAEAAHQEALQIRRHLAEANPQTYLPDVAMSLNNLAVLQQTKNEFLAAEAAYQEALQIRRRLAEANPRTYLPDVAMTAVNMSIFYLQSVPNREMSLAHAKEALVAGLPFVELVPSAQNYLSMALQVVEAWGLDRESYLDEAVKAWQNDKG